MVDAAPFEGHRPGYYYGTVDGCTGYYLDPQASGVCSRVAPSGSNDVVPHQRRGVKRGHDASGLLEGAIEEQLDDAKSVQKAIKGLAKKYRRNMEDRMKYASMPERFFESESGVMVGVEGLKAGTESKYLYECLIGGGEEVIEVVMGLLQHENGDIAASMISLLSDLTDADEVIEGDTSSSLNDLKTDLTTMLIKNGLIKVLLNALTSSLDESNSDEETAGVYNVLSIIENLVDLNPRELFVEMKDTDDLLGVLEWLTARVTQKRPRDGELDSNTQYASEILAVILQSAGPSVRNRFVDQLEGVDATLRALAPYRNSPPTTTEEAEFLENMFDVLCAVLMEDKAKRAFLDNEGVELMVLFLKGRTVSRTAALKSLDFATTRFAPAAGICIDKGLLSLLFSVFMGKLKVVGDDKKKIRKHIEANKEEEGVRCVSIMNNLFVGLADCTVEEAVSHNYRERLVAKFAEKDGEKCRRLIETLVVFAGRVASEEERIRLIFEGDGEDVKEEVLLAKMEAGLFTVQQCAMILAELWASGNFVLRKRILTILHEHELTLKYLDTTLREYVANLGGEEDRQQLDGKNGRIERVQLLIKTMVHEC